MTTRGGDPADTVLVGLVEDDDAIREGLRVLVDGSPGFRCVGAWASVEDALEGLPRELPDVLLMDIQLPECPAPRACGSSASATRPSRS